MIQLKGDWRAGDAFLRPIAVRRRHNRCGGAGRGARQRLQRRQRRQRGQRRRDVNFYSHSLKGRSVLIGTGAAAWIIQTLAGRCRATRCGVQTLCRCLWVRMGCQGSRGAGPGRGVKWSGRGAVWRGDGSGGGWVGWARPGQAGPRLCVCPQGVRGAKGLGVGAGVGLGECRWPWRGLGPGGRRCESLVRRAVLQPRGALRARGAGRGVAVRCKLDHA